MKKENEYLKEQIEDLQWYKKSYEDLVTDYAKTRIELTKYKDDVVSLTKNVEGIKEEYFKVCEDIWTETDKRIQAEKENNRLRQRIEYLSKTIDNLKDILEKV